MPEKLTSPENYINPETREGASFFEPISQDKIDDLKDEFSNAIGIDLSEFEIKVAQPGDASFDIIEILTKIQEKYGPKNTVEKLKSYGIDLSKSFDHTEENAKKMMAAGKEDGLEINGVLKGFVYNTSGNISYTAIREDQIEAMATIYSEKEGEKKEFIDKQEAKAYLESLAEKYLYHELGHSIFRKKINNPSDRKSWFETVTADASLTKELFDLQQDKYPNTSLPELMPVIIDEAFAEIFSEIATNGKVSSRVSSHPEAEKALKNLLLKYGFKLSQGGIA